MKKTLAILTSLFVTSVFALGVVNSVPALAANGNGGGNNGGSSASSRIKDGINSVGGNQSNTSVDQGIKKIINMLLFIIGAVSVLVIIYGGIMYVISAGDSTKVTNAKNTIMYAVIGLVVAILAYAIVNFVVGQFTNTP